MEVRVVDDERGAQRRRRPRVLGRDLVQEVDERQHRQKPARAEPVAERLAFSELVGRERDPSRRAVGDPDRAGVRSGEHLGALERRQRGNLVLRQHRSAKQGHLDPRRGAPRLLSGHERRSIGRGLGGEEDPRSGALPLLEPHGKRLLERGEQARPRGVGGCGEDSDRRSPDTHFSPYSRGGPSSQPGRVESGRTAIETARGPR